jgi:hypothetical protein
MTDLFTRLREDIVELQCDVIAARDEASSHSAGQRSQQAIFGTGDHDARYRGGSLAVRTPGNIRAGSGRWRQPLQCSLAHRRRSATGAPYRQVFLWRSA